MKEYLIVLIIKGSPEVIRIPVRCYENEIEDIKQRLSTFTRGESGTINCPDSTIIVEKGALSFVYVTEI